MDQQPKGFLQYIIFRVTEFFRTLTLRKTLLIAGYTGAFFLLLVEFFLIAIPAGIFGDLPDVDELKNLKSPEASEIYSSDSVLLGKYYYQNRTLAKFSELPPHLVKALISTEDVRFYKHRGIDEQGIGRVLFKTILLSKEESGGGSTITQQLAKNLFPRKTYTNKLQLMFTKIKEWALASRIERAYSKNEIITIYFNTVPFSDNAWGIKAAARTFFNTTPDSLTIEEAAVLVGMLKGSTYYNPRRNPKNATRRRNVVIDKMVKQDYLSPQVADSVKKIPLKLRLSKEDHNKGLAPYLREWLRQELEKKFKAQPREDGSYYNLYEDGLKIYLTINSKMQRYAEEAMQDHMKDLQRQFDQHWQGKQPWGKNESIMQMAMKRSDRYKELAAEGFSDEAIRKEFQKKVPMTVFSWNGERDTVLSPMDSIKYYLRFLHPGVMSMDPFSGKVYAWVGGNDFKYFKYDHVNPRTLRQVGSTFKPFVYAAAIESGFEPCQLIPNRRVVFEDFDDYAPGNASNVGDMISVQDGLAYSVNTITAYLIKAVGIDPVVKMARAAGIFNPLEEIPSIALGSADLSVFEMTGAYTMFANKGIAARPVIVERILDQSGNLVYRDKPRAARASSAEAAYITLDMMKRVTQYGTAGRVRWMYNLTNEIAGKTGTTQNHSDGWYIGLSPEIVTGVWVGAEDRRIHFRTLDKGSGANMALPIWGEFMKRVYADTTLPFSKKATFQKVKLPPDVELDCTSAYIQYYNSLLPEQDTTGGFLEQTGEDVGRFADSVRSKTDQIFRRIFRVRDREKQDTATAPVSGP